MDDIKNYNRADTVNMSETEMNKFRHIAGPTYMRSLGSSIGILKGLGLLKEGKDILQGRGIEDTMYDFDNNERGFEIGKQNVGINQKTLFDYIFKTEIEPYRN